MTSHSKCKYQKVAKLPERFYVSIQIWDEIKKVICTKYQLPQPILDVANFHLMKGELIYI